MPRVNRAPLRVSPNARYAGVGRLEIYVGKGQVDEVNALLVELDQARPELSRSEIVIEALREMARGYRRRRKPAE